MVRNAVHNAFLTIGTALSCVRLEIRHDLSVPKSLEHAADAKRNNQLTKLCCTFFVSGEDMSHVFSVREYVFYLFQTSETCLLRLFLNYVAKVVKRQQKFSHQTVKMSSYTSLSDRCNSIPSSRRSAIHSEPLLNVNVYRKCWPQN